MMKTNFRIAAAALACAALAPQAAQAQTVTYTENFTGASTNYSWYFVNGACLTAGSSTSLTSPGQVPSCVTLRQAGNYYNEQVGTFNDTMEPLLGGDTGMLPDTVSAGGALRLTNAGTVGSYPDGLFQNGGILSNFTFPLNTQGIQVTFTTETYNPGYGPGYNILYDGSDGMSFFLQDAAQSPDIGSTGGSLAYSCSNENLDPTIRTTGPEAGHQRGYDGIAGGYIGLGIDEYGNFLNGSINISGGGAVVEQAPTYSGLGPGGWDNTNAGYGWVPNRIGLRGAGSTSFYYLNKTWPAYFPSALTDDERNAAVQQACTTGFVWNYAGVSPGATPNNAKTTANPLYPTQLIPNIYSAVPLSGVTLPYNYAPIPNAYSVLSGVKISNQTALYRGTVTPVINTQYGVPITYNLKITAAGLLSLSYSYNGGANQSVITNQNIISNNGPLPANVRFGFAAALGGLPNTHEIMCFQATPQVTSQSSAGLNQKQSSKVQTGTQVYFSYYDPSVWSGSVTSQSLEVDPLNANNIIIDPVANWDASCVLTGVLSGDTCVKTGVAGPTAAQGVSSPSRTILSWNGSSGIPFEWANLTGGERTNLDTGDSAPINANRLNYLRGNRSLEQTTSGGGIYRDRTSVLGDIIDSSPTWVGPPSTAYPNIWADSYDGGTMAENSGQNYAAFTTAEQTRTNVVYAGANDGLLHGFRSGSYSASNTYVSTNNDGTEVLAYMPGYIVNSINTALAADDYSNPQYGHHFDVDAPPGTGDLFFGGAWHTWLIGGLGAGGAAIYALDITTPSNFSEGNASSLVIGEWSTTTTTGSSPVTTSTLSCAGSTSNATTTAANCGFNLGNTYGVPQIRRFHNGEWGAVFGNGFGSSTGDAGIYVMLVNSSGTPSFYYLSTGTKAAGKTGNGIAYTTPADLDGDHITDYVYAGDLLGNIWRFDLTSTNPSNWVVGTNPLYTTGSGQPITSKLVVASIAGTPYPRVLVEFGTGQQTPLTNTSAATYSTTQQYLYGIWDWNLATWDSKSTTLYADLPYNGVLAPTTALTTANLQVQTITYESSGGIDYRAVSATPICWAGTTSCNQYGWYLALPYGHANPTDVNTPGSTNTSLPTVYEQVIYSPVLTDGSFIVNTTIPPSSSLGNCSSTIAGGWTMAINPATGGAFTQSFFGANHTFVNVNGQVVSGEALSGTGSPSVVTYGTGTYLVTQTVSGSGTVVAINPPVGTIGSRLTWIQRR